MHCAIMHHMLTTTHKTQVGDDRENEIADLIKEFEDRVRSPEGTAFDRLLLGLLKEMYVQEMEGGNVTRH